MKTLLFVYGTLKRGCSNHHRLATECFVDAARTVAGFRLYDLGGYPGILPCPDDTDGVVGEVWSVRAATLQQLDEFEGVNEGLYRREPISLQPPFAGQTVHAYYSLFSPTGRRVVGSTWVE